MMNHETKEPYFFVVHESHSMTFVDGIDGIGNRWECKKCHYCACHNSGQLEAECFRDMKVSIQSQVDSLVKQAELRNLRMWAVEQAVIAGSGVIINEAKELVKYILEGE